MQLVVERFVFALDVELATEIRPPKCHVDRVAIQITMRMERVEDLVKSHDFSYGGIHRGNAVEFRALRHGRKRQIACACDKQKQNDTSEGI